MKKILLLLTLAFSAGVARADTLAGIPGTNNMSATASKLVMVDGLLEWLVAPSNLVAVQNTVILPRTNLAATVLDGALRITSGSPGASKVLTSDADGDATWEAASGGGSGTNAASMGVTNFFRFFPQTNALTGAGTTNLVIDGNQAALVRCVPGANFGLLFTNLVDGQEGRIEIKQDATGIRTGAVPYSNGGGGAFTNTYFGTEINWPLLFSTNANSVDQLKWVCRGTNVVIVGFTTGYPVP